MTTSAAGACRRCPALFVAALCVAFLSIDSCATESKSPPTTLGKQSADEKPAGSQGDVSRENCTLVLRGEALSLSQYDLVRKDELESLRKEVADSKKSPLVLAAPWIAFLIVGLVFAVAWLVLNWRERVVNWHKTQNPQTVRALENLVLHWQETQNQGTQNPQTVRALENLVLYWQKTQDVPDLENLNNQVSTLTTAISTIQDKVVATTKAIDDLWMKLAKVRLASGDPDSNNCA
jgi:hypothetical protein